MTGIHNYIRYNSGSREHLYRLLKWCDKCSLYRNIYKSRIKSKTSGLTNFPSELSIETTSLCNARCTICAHPDMKRAKGNMKTELVKSLIKQAGQGEVNKLFLSGFGEPLIDKRLPEFVEYAKKQNIDNISIVTNGYLLTPQIAGSLVDSGLNEIIISMDGFTPETYNKIRVGLDFEKLAENISGLPSIKKRSKIQITISCVSLTHNQKERQEAFSRFGRYVDGIYFRQAQGWTGKYGESDAGYTPHFEPNSIPCRYLWDSASVYIDGSVPTCCLDFEAEGVMGNAMQDSLEDIWRGERFKNYRTAHLQNRKSELVPCGKCGYYSVWW